MNVKLLISWHLSTPQKVIQAIKLLIRRRKSCRRNAMFFFWPGQSDVFTGNFATDMFAINMCLFWMGTQNKLQNLTYVLSSTSIFYFDCWTTTLRLQRSVSVQMNPKYWVPENKTYQRAVWLVYEQPDDAYLENPFACLDPYFHRSLRGF